MLWVYIFIMCRGNWWGKGFDFVSKNLHTMEVLCRKRKYFALKMQFLHTFIGRCAKSYTFAVGNGKKIVHKCTEYSIRVH